MKSASEKPENYQSKMDMTKDRKAILKLQSIFVISKSKRPSEILRDNRTSTYQICRIEEYTNRTTKFHK